MALKEGLSLEPIPQETRALAWRQCPKGTAVMDLRDVLGTLYDYQMFAPLHR